MNGDTKSIKKKNKTNKLQWKYNKLPIEGERVVIPIGQPKDVMKKENMIREDGSASKKC